MKPNLREVPVRLRGSAVALGAGALEHDLALRFELVERGIGIRQRCRPRADGVRERANTGVREQHTLKRGEIVEKPCRDNAQSLRVILERPERLLLKRGDAAIQLVSAKLVGAAEPGTGVVGAREPDIIDGRDHPPDVGDPFRQRRLVGRGIDQPDVCRQREADPDETVLAKIAEITGALAVGPEIIRVDRPEQRVVRIRIPLPPPLEQLESRLGACGGELEVVREHVAVGACAPVSVEPVKPAVEEREGAAHHRVARLSAAVEHTVRREARHPALGLRGLTGSHRQRGRQR